MENVVDKSTIQLSVVAPYADSIIPLFLTSLTGMRYRTLNCMECGAEFLERNNDTMYRLNDGSLPSEVNITGQSVKAKCGNCSQWYGVQVSLDVVYDSGGLPLYMQPQSVYIAVETQKKLRYVYCLECGRAFYSISDRIKMMVDNRVPFDMVDSSRLGPMETLCHSNNCGQAWAVML